MPISSLARNLHLCFTKFKTPLIESEEDQTHPMLIKRYNSAYEPTSKFCSSSSTQEPDFATALSSQRFFFSSPGLSNSIIESTHSTSAASNRSVDITCDESVQSSVNDSVAVPTFSPDPYADFRRSMQEMVEARRLVDVKANWDYLHELLLRYLALNPKSTHKFIVGAFADLLVTLLATPPQDGGGCRESGRADGGSCGCDISRQSM